MIRGFWVGIYVNSNRHLKIKDCEIFDSPKVAVYGNFVNDLVIDGCYIHQTGQAAVSLSGQGITINGNRLHRTGPVGGCFFISYAAFDVKITNNIMQGTTGGGAIDGTSSVTGNNVAGGKIVISGNVFDSNSWDAFASFRNGIVVTGNTFSDNGYMLAVAGSQTIELGIVGRYGQGGSGYQVGEVIRLAVGNRGREDSLPGRL